MGLMRGVFSVCAVAVKTNHLLDYRPPAREFEFGCGET